MFIFHSVIIDSTIHPVRLIDDRVAPTEANVNVWPIFVFSYKHDRFAQDNSLKCKCKKKGNKTKDITENDNLQKCLKTNISFLFL